MSVESIGVVSTSPTSAECEELVLRQTKTTRLVFRPMLVENPHDARASVKGALLFQRKGPNDAWEDWKEYGLSSLRKGEGIELELKSAEVFALYGYLTNLYELHQQHGIPMGSHTFVDASDTLRQVARLTMTELDEAAATSQTIGSEAFVRLLQWASRLEDAGALVAQVAALDPDETRRLTAISSLSVLTQALAVWEANSTNADEEFWQQQLLQYPFVLEHLFAQPIVVIKDKAYMGGKTLENTGGGYVDYLCQNALTDNVAFVEIKTPSTPLLAKEYRDGVYGMSRDVVNGIAQLLDYRRRFTENVHSLAREAARDVEACEPPCVLIVGHAQEMLDNAGRKRSFELMRRQLIGVQVVTYDELFTKVERLIRLLENDGVRTPSDAALEW